MSEDPLGLHPPREQGYGPRRMTGTYGVARVRITFQAIRRGLLRARAWIARRIP